MLSWIIQITIVSIILIFLVHHLINFFKSTLTVPKIKDLVNSPTQKYENMYNIIKNNSLSSNTPSGITGSNSADYTLIDLLPTKQETPTSMKNELKNFLKKQMQGSSSSPLDTIDSSGPSYATF
jgi:hypothetical protein